MKKRTNRGEIKQLVKSIMFAYGYKKNVDYNINNRTIHVARRLQLHKEHIASLLESQYPEVVFMWERSCKMAWY